MKKILILSMLLALFACLSAVTWTVDLVDSYGDGWNGGALTVFVNGTAVLEGITLSDDSGPESFSFDVVNGDQITTDYTAGSYGYENEYYIYDQDGVLIASQGEFGVTPGDITAPITVIISSLLNPASFNAAAAGTSEIILTWTQNGSGDNVMVAYNTTNSFGIPSDGTAYTAGNTIDGGGTVIYNGSGVAYSHSGLDDMTTYYYKAWSVNGNNYSTGLEASDTTLMNPITAFPFNEGFENAWVGTPSAPLGWRQITVSGANVWNRSSSSPHSGSYCALAPWASAGGEHLLVTPPLDFGTNAYRLKFWLKGSSYSGTELFVELGSSCSSEADFSTPLAWFSPGNNMPTVWTEITIDLSSYSGISYIAFRMVDDDGYSLYIDDVKVEAIPAAPIFAYSPTSIDFGSVCVNQYSTWQNVTITNIGGGTLVLPAEAVRLSGEMQDQFEFDPSNLPFSLSAGQSGLIPVRFNPADIMNYNDAALQITYGEGKAVYEVSLTGTGIGPFVNMTNGSATLNDESWNFFDSGGIGASYSSSENYTYTFSTEEGYRLKVEFSAFNTESGYDFLKIYDGVDATGTLIGNYSGTTLPPSYSGSEAGSLTFVFTSDSGLQYSGWEAVVSSEAIPTGPILTVDPTSWDFGDVDIAGSGTSKVFTISNTGVDILEITEIGITGDPFFLDVVPDMNLYLSAGESETFTVRFSPSTVDSFHGSVTINTTLGDKSRTIYYVYQTGSGIARPAGSTCDNPYPVELPLVGFTGDTGLYEDDYESSWVSPSFNYLGGDDMVLQFSLAEKSNLIGTLTATNGTWIGMVLTQEAPNATIPVATYGRASSSSGSVCSFSGVVLDPGTYFLIVSTYPEPQAVEFSLDLSSEIHFDVPASTPTEVATGVDLESDVNLNINPTIDETNDVVVSLPNYDEMVDPTVIGLSGTGITNLVFTVGEGTWYGTLYVGGSWYQGNPYPLTGPGTITFTGVDFDAKGEVIVVLSEGSDPTLPVELSSFTAVLTADLFVQIAWVAESETNHSGYNIFRSESVDLSEAIKVNSSLIEEGSELGSQIRYSFIDNEAYINMQYYYWLESVELDGVVSYYGPLTVTIGDPELDPEAPAIPKVTTLHNAFPNPFNPSTTIGYYMAEGGEVDIQIYNLRGQLMKSYTAHHTDQGTYYMTWDGRDSNGHSVGSGIYLYRMSSGNYVSTKKMVLSK